MSREINPFGLRMPPELRAALEAAAADTGRSLNAELVFRLQRSLETETGMDKRYSLRFKAYEEAIADIKKLNAKRDRTPEEDEFLKTLHIAAKSFAKAVGASD